MSRELTRKANGAAPRRVFSSCAATLRLSLCAAARSLPLCATRPKPGCSKLGCEVIGTALGLLAVFALIGINACFVAAEFSLVSVDRWRVAEAAGAGRRSARIAMKHFERMTFYISGTQLGVTVVSLLLGWLAEPLIADLLARTLLPGLSLSAARAVSVAVAFLIVTSLQIVLGEQVPKMLAIARSLRTSLFFARPMRVYGYLSLPFIAVISRTTTRIVRLFGIEPIPELRSVLTLTELEHVVKSSGRSGELDSGDVQLLTRSLRFFDKTAAEALVPRVEVVTVRPEDTLDELVLTSAKSGFSRFPVVEEELDFVVGVVGVKAVHKVPREERSKLTAAELMSEALAVPDGAELGRLLGEMSRRRQSLAIVVDEHGGTVGIITIEDIVEEIVGEIGDEHDLEAHFTQPTEPGVRLLDGDLSTDQVEEQADLRLPGGPYETLAGFALYNLGRIPVKGDSFDWGRWHFEVAEILKRRIVSVWVSERPSEDSGGEGGSGFQGSTRRVSADGEEREVS